MAPKIDGEEPEADDAAEPKIDCEVPEADEDPNIEGVEPGADENGAAAPNIEGVEAVAEDCAPNREAVEAGTDEDVAKRGELELAADEGAENKDEEDPKSGAEPLAGAAPKGDGAETVAEEEEAPG